MSAIDRPSSTACRSLSMTQGPAISTSASAPNTTPSATDTGFTPSLYELPSPVSDRRHVGRDPLPRHLALVGGFHEAGKQRMRAQRLRLELRVELNGQVPRVTRQLDDLDELAVERSADDAQAALDE